MSPALFQGFSDLKTNKKWYLVDIQVFLKYKMLANSRHLENTEVGESLFIFIIPTWVEIHIRGEGERKYEIAVSPLQNHTGHWTFFSFCEAQARVRQGSARYGERPQSFNPCPELTLKLVATTTHPPPPASLISLNYWPDSGQVRLVEVRGGQSLWVTLGSL